MHMPLIEIVMTLIVIGVLLWLVNRSLPMQGTIKSIQLLLLACERRRSIGAILWGFSLRLGIPADYHTAPSSDGWSATRKFPSLNFGIIYCIRETSLKSPAGSYNIACSKLIRAAWMSI